MKYYILILLFILFFSNYPVFSQSDAGTYDTEISIFTIYNDTENKISRFIKMRIVKYDSTNYEIEIESLTEMNETIFTILKIDEIDFTYFFENIMKINFIEIIQTNNEFEPLRDEFLIIAIKTHGYNMVLQINDPSFNVSERKLEAFNSIIINFFEKAELIIMEASKNSY